ncbi:glycosyltransferase family 39 protein [Verrucosispora sp. WMMD573]|uniref:glycosyltransferase family 39 protein n=1 Tax=Verrucosispora sp. WMMD573 TaxID=3015149 RepID=UPI00248CE313|nr:glycosyltransferase family 39 protein [Verrucosispora sp. WMMD573]WBB54912.1 glycosyltransferase family 39 protein [Verrucosispora sp. WMMD573]
MVGIGVRLSGGRLRSVPVWLVPATVTLLVTLVGLDTAQLWRDELATWSAATRGLGGLFRLAGTIDAATGPYYLFMHAWLASAGDSVAALRLPSALAMAATAGLTAVLGHRLWDTRVGTLAGLLFAVLPGTSRYGQEARPYALVSALAVLSTLLLVDALRRRTRRRWIGYAAATTALGLTHLVALTLLAAHAVAVLTTTIRADPATDADAEGRRDRPSDSGKWQSPAPGRVVGYWLAALVPVAVAVVPLALTAGGQRGRQLDWVDAARPGDLAALAGGVAQSGVVGGVLVGLAALGAARAGRRALLPLSSVLAPVLLLFLAGLVVPLWVPRYLVFVVPFGCLLAGAALTSVRLPAALAVVALAGLLGLPEQAALRRTHEWPRTATVDYRATAGIIAASRRPGDAVVYSPRDSWLFLDLGLRYHLGGRVPRDALLAEGQEGRGDLWAAECDRPAECLAGVDRVWLVLAGRSSDPLAAVPGAKGDALRDRFTVTEVWPRAGLTLALLTRHG